MTNIKKNKLFDLGNEWQLTKSVDASKIHQTDVDVFFRGLGGTSDCAQVMAKLAKAELMPQQVVMIDGIDFGDKRGLMLAGEASIGLKFLSSDDCITTDELIKQIYDVLFDYTPAFDDGNDMDQYGKIQIRHRVDNGSWTDSIYKEQREVA